MTEAHKTLGPSEAGWGQMGSSLGKVSRLWSSTMATPPEGPGHGDGGSEPAGSLQDRKQHSEWNTSQGATHGNLEAKAWQQWVRLGWVRGRQAAHARRSSPQQLRSPCWPGLLWTPLLSPSSCPITQNLPSAHPVPTLHLPPITEAQTLLTAMGGCRPPPLIMAQSCSSPAQILQECCSSSPLRSLSPDVLSPPCPSCLLPERRVGLPAQQDSGGNVPMALQ